MVYTNGKFSMYNFTSGYIEPLSTAIHYRYYMKNHLGNNRVVSTLSGSIMQTNHYYPYGANLTCSTNQSRQQYKYNGNLAQRSHRLSACSPSGGKLKNEGDNNLELDRTHGLNWYDYIARQYDPATGQFTSMDDFCEKYYHISPYVYCGGNPISRVDPDGRDWYEHDGYIKWFCSVDNTYTDKNKAVWSNIGHTYTDSKTGIYYSLFGQKYGKDHKYLAAIKNLDNAFMTYAEYIADCNNNMSCTEIG